MSAVEVVRHGTTARLYFDPDAPAPVVSSPGEHLTPAVIGDQCRMVEVWAEVSSSIEELRDAGNKLAAIAQYLERTSVDGRARVAEAQRRLEVRIGVLLGPASANGKVVGSPASDPDGLTANQRSQFRKMADHPDVVEAVIDESDDESPASRRRVMDEINRAKHTEPGRTPEEEAEAAHKAEVSKSANKLRSLVSAWPRFHSIMSGPDRDEVLALLDDEERAAVREIERLVRVATAPVKAPERATSRSSDPETSRRVPTNLTENRLLALAALVAHGPLTDFELAEHTGKAQTSIGCRRKDLVDMGLAEKAEGTRPSPSGSPAQVWRVTEAGVLAHRRTRGGL